jgi:hypothetical protein
MHPWSWDGHYKSILLPADEEIIGSLRCHIINTSDLSKHIVNIKYARNNTSIPSLPKTRDVDEEVIAILFHLIDTGELNQSLMDGLGKTDYDFLTNLLFKCGLRRMIKTNRQAGPTSQVANGESIGCKGTECYMAN